MAEGGPLPRPTTTASEEPGAQAYVPVASAAGPIVALPSESAATASRPDQALDERYHAYESNPAPWWIGLAWIAFLVFGAAYLIVNLLD